VASQAEKKRLQKARTQSRALAAAVERATPGWRPPADRPPAARVAEPPAPRKKAGLVWLYDKDKLSLAERKTGERFGRSLRISWIQDGMALRSSLDIVEVRGSGGGAALLEDYTGVILGARREVDAARAYLRHHPGMIAAITLICGRELTPWEALELRGDAPPKQADVLQVETSLRLALDQLGEFYAELDSK
jgi:hypothetical protein